MSNNSLSLCAALLIAASTGLFADLATVWEQHQEGVALSVELSTQNDFGRPIVSIQIQIKNTSDKIKYFAGIDPMESEFEVFYENANGKRIPLRDYSPKPPEFVDGNIPPFPIKPGEILKRTLDLTPLELATIRGHPVICRVNISRQEVGDYKPVESSPKILIGVKS